MKRLAYIALFYSAVPTFLAFCATGAAAWYGSRALRRAWPMALVVLLAACPRPPITSEHRDAFAAALDGWHRAGLPDPGDCLDGARVELVSDLDDFDSRCGNYSHVKAAACLSSYARGMFGRRDGYIVLIAPGYVADDYTIVHEAMHGLVRCAGLSEFPDVFDAYHSNPRVWSAAGREQSAQWLSGALAD